MLLIPAAPTIPAKETATHALTTPAEAFQQIRDGANWMDIAREVQTARAAGAGQFNGEAEVRLGLPAGDMTGDGRADILVPTQRPAGLAALGGEDGAPLWTRALEDDYQVWPTGDHTGDGLADAVVQTFTITSSSATGPCSQLACVASATWVFHWDVSVISGADGTVAWTKRYPGFERTLYVQGLQTIESENVTVIVEPSRHVLVSSYDAIMTTAAFIVTSRGEALRGSDGAVMLERTHEDRPDFGVMYAAGRDGSVAWEIEENAFLLAQTNVRIETYDAALAPRWTYEQDALRSVFGVAANADHDGDGEDDILLIAPRSGNPGVSALAGGQLLWEGLEGIPLRLGDGDYDGADDLALIQTYPNDYDSPYEVHRVSGKTGQAWLVTRPDFDRVANAATGITIQTDYDGDEALDLVWLHLSLEDEYREQLLVESGATGAALLEQDAAGIRPVIAAGDLDGDGTPDLLALTLGFSFDPDDTTFRLDAQAIRIDGTEIWSWTETYAELPGLYIRSGADMVGAEGDDLAFTVITSEGASYRSRIQALDGATGAAAWTSGALAPS